MMTRQGRYGCVWAILLTMAMTAGCRESKQEDTVLIRPVRYQEVRTTDGLRKRVFSGTARSSLESNLSFRVGGTVNRVAVKVGDTVAKGQMIALLDDKDYALQVQEAQAGLEQARAQALNASSNYVRIRKLYENDTVPISDLDQSRAAYESAQAAVRSIEKKLELAKSRLGYTRLSAPFTGAVAQVLVDENENVGPGQPVIALASEQALEVEVAIPEVLIADVKDGADVTVTFDAVPGSSFKGTVTEVGVATTRFATTYPVTLTLADGIALLKPGMAANVTFEFGSGRDSAIFVPSHCVVEEKGQRYVYVVVPAGDKRGTVKRVPVTVGELVSRGLEILSGLAENDRVITAGISRLTDGMTVKLLDHSPYERTQATTEH